MTRRTSTLFAFMSAQAIVLAQNPVRGDDGIAFPDAHQRATLTISTAALNQQACRETEALESDDARAEFAMCFGQANTAQFQLALDAAKRFDSSVAAYNALTDTKASTNNCSASQAQASPETRSAQKRLDDAVAALEAANIERDVANDNLSKARSVEANLKAAFNRAKGPPAELKQMAVDVAAAEIAASEAEKRFKAASNKLAAAETEQKEAKAGLDNARAKARKAAAEEVESAREQFRDAVDAALDVDRSPQDFEVLLTDPKRMNACTGLNKRRLRALGAEKSAERERQAKSKVKAARTQAHREDLMRKAQATASGVFSGNGYAEQPGSPDTVIFSVMSALGADSRTNGTQAVMTLNIASLFAQTEEQRLRWSPTARNLTLRVMLPLESTKDVPRTGSVRAAANDTTGESVTRYSAILGSSLFDETDTRLPSHDACYQAALAYRPFAEKEDADAAAQDERADYFDVCNRIAARQNRLAWRFASGFETRASDKTTKVDLLAGALVWAPTQWVYFNFYYQGIRLPQRIHNIGVGASFGGNIGGPASGVRSWGRVGLDVLGVYSYTPETSTTEKYDDVEVRIAPTFRAKVQDNSIASLGIGPRFLGRDMDHPGVLASFALVYDVDALIDQTLIAPVATK